MAPWRGATLILSAALVVAPLGGIPPEGSGSVGAGAALAQITIRDGQIRMRTRYNPDLHHSEGGRPDPTEHRQQSQRQSAETAQRRQNRAVQGALNHFGFAVGAADGIIGPRSRAAIAAFQEFLGEEGTGQLTAAQRRRLLEAHAAARADPAGAEARAAAHPMGMRGLLLTHSEAGEVAQDVGSGMPTEMILPEIAPICDRATLAMTARGGPLTIANMTDPAAALAEQFCIARAASMARSDELLAGAGLPPAEVASGCDQLGITMAPLTSELSSTPRDEMLGQLAAMVPETGMSLDELAGSGLVCLGVGYRMERADIASGAAMLLVAAGQAAYAEVLGHHLALGLLGDADDMAVARPWYLYGLDAIDAGAEAVFLPELSGRVDLLRAAAALPVGDAANGPGEEAPAGLPRFGITQ